MIYMFKVIHYCQLLTFKTCVLKYMNLILFIIFLLQDQHGKHHLKKNIVKLNLFLDIDMFLIVQKIIRRGMSQADSGRAPPFFAITFCSCCFVFLGVFLFFFVFVFCNRSEELQTVFFEVKLIINNALLTYIYQNTIETCLTLNHLLFGRQLLYSSNTKLAAVRNLTVLSSTRDKINRISNHFLDRWRH